MQEGLTNALKHAQATLVKLRVRYDAGEVLIEITDDGRGPSDKVKSGHGLIGMSERVAMFGGTLDFGAAPRGGFRLRASIPRTTPRP